MPSAKPEARRSLARRVALASALAAALGGVVAALAGGLVTTGLITEHDEDLPVQAAEKLAEETLEELDDVDDEGRPRPRPTLAAALAHGLEDLDLPEARAAIYRGTKRIAGDASLPYTEGGACEDIPGGDALRVCAHTEDGLTFVLGLSAARAARERTLVAWAVLVGVLVGGLAAGLVSGRVAGYSLVPLSDLRDRVRRVDPNAPDAAVLEPEASHAEVEELRVAVSELVSRLGDALLHARHFAAQAAHELRTPLATLSGELELATEGTGAVDADALRRVRRDVDALNALVERLLVLATPSRAAGEGEAVDLADVVTEALERIAQRARVTAALADDVLVRGDATLLRALVTNALDNALKFSAGEVRVTVAAHEDTARIDVLDDGPGIAEDDRARVFAPFYRSPLVRASGTAGHGIGLALIAHVAAAHGGDVAIIGAARGLHLRVTLPRWTST